MGGSYPTAEELSSLITTKNLIKGASDSRTIRNNDGTGKTDERMNSLSIRKQWLHFSARRYRV